jgi:4-carboxymuconolactone decarboxylase
MGMEQTLEGLKRQGRQALERVFGPDYMGRRATAESDFSADMREYSDICMGAVWGRSGLDLRTRRLITICILALQNRPEQVELHMQAALKGDCSMEEIKELVIHLSLYCGWPTAVGVNNIAERLLKNLGKT